MGVFSAGILPMVETHGVVVTNALSALFVWLGFGCVFLILLRPHDEGEPR